MYNWSSGTWDRRYANKKLAKNYSHFYDIHISFDESFNFQNQEPWQNQSKNEYKKKKAMSMNHVAENCG